MEIIMTACYIQRPLNFWILLINYSYMLVHIQQFGALNIVENT